MAKRWLRKQETDQDDWLMSYADMITLLLAMFVLLLSMAKIDPIKYEQVESSMAREIGRRESTQPMESLKRDLTQAVREMKLDDSQLTIGSDGKGLMLELDGSTFFAPHSATLTPEFQSALAKIGEKLNEPRYSAFLVEVRGHTDDQPTSNPIFPTNWELSAARAAIVVRSFIQHGVDPTRLSAEGVADTRPRVSNRDINGNPLPRNQALNRRVTIHIFPR